jgi:hypothetical protein
MALYFILRGIYKARSGNSGVMVHRAALRVRVPRAHARPSDLINLNQGVRVPRTVTIIRLIIFTLNESKGMKVIFESTSAPRVYLTLECIPHRRETMLNYVKMLMQRNFTPFFMIAL